MVYQLDATMWELKISRLRASLNRRHVVQGLLHNLGMRRLPCARASAYFCAMAICSIPCMMWYVLQIYRDERKRRQRGKHGTKGYASMKWRMSWAQCYA